MKPPGVAGTLTIIFFSVGSTGASAFGGVTSILPTAPGVATDTVTPDGAVIIPSDGAVIVPPPSTTGATVDGNPPSVIVGADTFTDTFGLISGSTGSTGLILAPTSIVSLNTSVSTATPFPAINLSFPIFPVDFNILLPLLVP